MDYHRWGSSDGSTAQRTRVGSTSVLAALGLLSSICVAEAASAKRKLFGCWTQTSPYPRDQIPAGLEWGRRTWCFRARGVLETVNTACGRGRSGCDGWDGQYRYRWRGREIELEGFLYDEKDESRIWRRCLPVFSNDRFVLTNCEMSQEPFVRDKDTNRTE